MTIAGIAPQGFFGDRLASTPPDFYLPIEAMPVLANVPYVHDPDVHWLYMIGRVKPGTALAPLQQKVSALLRQAYAPSNEFSSEHGKSASCQGAYRADTWRCGHSASAGQCNSALTC